MSDNNNRNPIIPVGNIVSQDNGDVFNFGGILGQMLNLSAPKDILDMLVLSSNEKKQSSILPPLSTPAKPPVPANKATGKS